MVEETGAGERLMRGEEGARLGAAEQTYERELRCLAGKTGAIPCLAEMAELFPFLAEWAVELLFQAETQW